MLIDFFGAPVPRDRGPLGHVSSFLRRPDVVVSAIATAFSMAAAGLFSPERPFLAASAVGAFAASNFFLTNIVSNEVVPLIFPPGATEDKCINTHPEPLDQNRPVIRGSAHWMLTAGRLKQEYAGLLRQSLVAVAGVGLGTLSFISWLRPEINALPLAAPIMLSLGSAPLSNHSFGMWRWRKVARGEWRIEDRPTSRARRPAHSGETVLGLPSPKLKG